MNTHGPRGGEPCPDCGAMVGHREVVEDTPATATMNATFGRRPCRLGAEMVSREECEFWERKAGEEHVRADKAEKDVWRLAEKLEPMEYARDSYLEALRHCAVERDAYFENLTAVQALCTEILEEARALRAAASWADVTDRPLSALDIIGRDRDEWKRRATEAEQENHRLRVFAAAERVMEDNADTLSRLADDPLEGET